MFTQDAIIDTIQTSKKAWVKAFVTNETFSTTLNKLIDDQGTYTKKAVKAATEAGTTLVEESVKNAKDLAKFDIFKFNESLVKSFTLSK